MMRATLSELAALVDGEVVGDPDFTVSGLAALSDAIDTDLSFLADGRYEEAREASGAGALLLDRERAADRPSIRVDDPYFAFLTLLDRFHPRSHPDWGIHPSAVVSEEATLGEEVHVGPCAVIEAGARLGDRVVVYPGTYIGTGCQIGDDSLLFSNVSVYGGTRIGSGVTVHSGSVLGSDGFGYHLGPDGAFHKIPQVGGVVVEDNVEIGANTCVDRAMMGDTVIRTGTKLDNLVQIAHNCSVGPHTVMAGQAGLSGSVTIGSHVQVGGQVGVADHLEVEAGAALMAQSGIGRSVGPGEKMLGSPAAPRGQAFRAHAYGLRLPEIFREVKALRRQVEELSVRSE